jgi:hypothetical protein
MTPFELNPLNETDDGAFVVSSHGCEHADGNLRFCIEDPPGSGNYKKVWKTNNYREITFKAVINQSCVCPASYGGRVAQNMSGYPVGHIAAVTAL